MGGTISATSKFGEGSEFDFSIVTVRSENTPRATTICDLSSLAGSRVLIVDDNKTNRAILRIQMEHWQLVPVVAQTAMEALSILSADNRFDLIITDMEMPEMDGAGLANAIRERGIKIPMVMLSSIGDDTKRKFPGLFSSVLVKPVKQYQLCQSIQIGLNSRGEMQQEQRPASSLSTDFATQYPLRILVAEDNVINQKLVDRILSKLGYKAEIVENGLLAIEALQKREYDAILMDIQMPVVDGLEATRQARELQIKQPYIIAITANAMSEDKEISLKNGMDDYLAKPMKLEDLTDVLKRASAVV